ncbi:SMP-30/gluconolactonase/LRE family protein [Bordetella sp. BOR01]|uniref:SMP-30/gluconolactonase/LRE family protein n=1 Tax=Bordetella sp. BOR01 TaxID=2854779 RepID=UPI001C459224|nr:SMP-30/gluconolactonase/LRE family protein [Bordetella sp. BOR01]MBV7482111.1 SMP-30/gluconolactonase/LRE family protein [Bordetella sp. BOR01]
MKLTFSPLWCSDERALLGENPLWDDASGELYWVDAANPAVYRLSPGAGVRRYALPRPVASIFLSHPGRLVVAMRRSVVELDLGSGRQVADLGLSPPSENERFNDGRCGPDGALWISTMDRELKRDIGSLARMDSAGGRQSFGTSAALGNGVCFSPDGGTLYFSDTQRRTIFRYVLRDGLPAERTVFAQLDAAPGRPDGCTVDADGCLWSARAGGGRIDRYAPDGRLIDYLETPVSHPTHCAFGAGGLYITSLRYPEASFRGQPLAGATLAHRIDVQGLPQARFLSSATAANTEV